MSMLAAAWTLAWKDLRCFFRDRTALVLSLLVPVALVSVFGWIMAYAFGGGGGAPQIRLHVADLADSAASRRFAEQLNQTDFVSVRSIELTDELRRQPPNRRQERLSRLVSDGDAHHVLIIPADFDATLQQQQVPAFQMLRDPGRKMEDQLVQLALMQATIAELGSGAFTGAVERMLSQDGMGEIEISSVRGWMDSLGETIQAFYADQPAAATASDGHDEEHPAAVEARTGATDAEASAQTGFGGMLDFVEQAVPLENIDIAPPDRAQQVTYQQAQSVAGMTVMMLLFALTSCGSVLLTEREEGTLQRLFAQRIPRSAVLVGKFLFVFIVGIAQMTVLFAYGEWMFRVGLFRDPLTLLVLSISWIVAGGAFGMFLASVSRSTKQAESLASLLILVMAALGGCWFPLQMMNLPPLLEAVCKSTPTYWAMSGFQGMLWSQLPWYSSKTMLALGWQWTWAAGLIAAAAYFYRRNFCRG